MASTNATSVIVGGGTSPSQWSAEELASARAWLDEAREAENALMQQQSISRDEAEKLLAAQRGWEVDCGE